MSERLNGRELIEKQRLEQEDFLLHQAARLHKIDFDWKIPQSYQHKGSRYNKGFLIQEDEYPDGKCARVLTPRGELVRLKEGHGLHWMNYNDKPFLFSAHILLEVEKAVDQEVAKHEQVTNVSAVS